VKPTGFISIVCVAERGPCGHRHAQNRFSTTLQEATWENMELHHGNLAEVVRDLKAGEV